MDKEREGRLKAKQCLSPSESFTESFLHGLEISYETTLEAYNNYLILNLLPADIFLDHGYKDNC